MRHRPQRTAATGATLGAACEGRRQGNMDTALDSYLDKLWHTLFSKGVPGLVSPAEIRRRGQPHRQVRAAELREVARVQRELAALVEGRLRLTSAGRLAEAADEAALETVR